VIRSVPSTVVFLALIVVPGVAAAVAYRLPGHSARSALLRGVAVLHVALVGAVWRWPGQTAVNGWIGDDALGLVVLTLVSLLFLAVAQYAAATGAAEGHGRSAAFETCLLTFLSASSLVALSQHVALLWVGMEATTLSLAPLVYYRHNRRSLEAAWKYLMLSSVGIALALLAVFLLATAQSAGADARPLVLPDLIDHAGELDRWWLRAAFVFALVGFGTKMGLAPLHAWKPDTYGEAPNLVAALMAGGLTSCAFLGLARFTQVAMAAGLGAFVQPLLIALGFSSLVVAAAFVIGQGDVKRLLAYSSVEHMGLLVLGLGVGGLGAYGSALHVLNNGLAKGLLFLTVGNLTAVTGSSAAQDLRGMVRARPVSAGLLLIGLFAVTGSPPFGPFVSEFSIIVGAVQEHHPWVATIAVLLLVVIFVGVAAMMLDIVYGEPSAAVLAAGEDRRERLGLVSAPIALAAALLLLGVYIPGPLRALLASAANSLGGAAP
jgi:hydrogenase-4 component F